MTAAPDVVVALGTDHHPFARLVEWVDHWAEAHPDRRCTIQHGSAPPPTHAEGHPVLDPAIIPQLLEACGVALGHAGPGTLLDARAAGHRPILVARRAHLGEVVDNHPVTFGRWMPNRGQAVCVDTEAELHARIDDALARPEAHAIASGPVAAPPAVVLLGDLVDGMMTR
ncbi:N/A [soil metagenome]